MYTLYTRGLTDACNDRSQYSTQLQPVWRYDVTADDDDDDDTMTSWAAAREVSWQRAVRCRSSPSAERPPPCRRRLRLPRLRRRRRRPSWRRHPRRCRRSKDWRRSGRTSSACCSCAGAAGYRSPAWTSTGRGSAWPRSASVPKTLPPPPRPHHVHNQFTANNGCQ